MMICQDYQKFYKEIPEDQRGVFLDFHKENPSSTLCFQNKDMNYIATGKGHTAVVFLHGTHVRPDMWLYPMLQLEDSFRIITPLLPPFLFGVQETADFIQSILKQENIHKVIIVGISFGGDVAQYFSEKYPEMLNKIIMFNAGISNRDSALMQLEKFKKIVKLLPSFLINNDLELTPK